MIVMAETEYDKIVDRALDDLSDQVEDSKIEHKKIVVHTR